MCDDSVSIEDIIEPVTIQVISLHQIPAEPSELVPPNTTDHIDSLWMALSITRGDGASCCRKVATGKSRILRSMFPRVIWNQKLTLDIEIKNLPLDASLLIELYCTATVPDRNIEKGMVSPNRMSYPCPSRLFRYITTNLCHNLIRNSPFVQKDFDI